MQILCTSWSTARQLIMKEEHVVHDDPKTTCRVMYLEHTCRHHQVSNKADVWANCRGAPPDQNMMVMHCGYKMQIRGLLNAPRCSAHKSAKALCKWSQSKACEWLHSRHHGPIKPHLRHTGWGRLCCRVMNKKHEAFIFILKTPSLSCMLMLSSAVYSSVYDHRQSVDRTI